MAMALMMVADIDADDARYRDEILPMCVERAGDGLRSVSSLLLDNLDTPVIVDVLNAMVPVLDAGQKDALLAWARDRRRSVTQWGAVVRRLAADGHSGALRSLHHIVRTDPTTGPPAAVGSRTDRWLCAANILIDVDLPGNADPIWKIADRYSEIADKLLDFIAGRGLFARALLEDVATEQHLSWLYEQLLQRSSPVPTPTALGGFIGPAQRRVQVRDRLPYILAARPTDQASVELKRLADAHPDIAMLRMLWRGHVRGMAARTWQPLTPPQVVELVAATDRRIVHDSRQMQDVVLEALGRLQDALSAPNGLVTLLWNREDEAGTSGWWPVWEVDFSDLVATFLRLDLAGHQVVINREVQVVRPNLSGQRLDIIVEANPRPGIHGQEPVAVILECKGCWNSGLGTDLEQQLVDRYLTKPRYDAGIFLVGFFDCERWRINKVRPIHQRRHSLEELRRTLAQAAADQEQAKPVTVASVVLDCRLPD
jgi:hypothetical protein